MGRSSDKFFRVELRYPRAQPGPVYEEVAREATTRGVSVAQHIQDLLQHRYNARHGIPYMETLWVPTNEMTAAEPPSPEEVALPTGGRAAAKAWLKRKS